MRKNLEAVLAAWNSNRPNRSSDSIWTDGRNIYSYDTALLTEHRSGPLVLNVTKYSPTTSAHQAGIRHYLLEQKVVEVDGLNRGISADALANGEAV